jgi:hypothetical protein
VATYRKLCPNANGEARVDFLVKNKTPKLVQQAYAVKSCDLEETERMYPLIQQAIRSGLFLPNRSNYMCSRKYCSFWRACQRNSAARSGNEKPEARVRHPDEVMLTIAAPWGSHEEGLEEQVAAAVRHHLTKAGVRVLTVEAHRPHLRIAAICYRCHQPIRDNEYGDARIAVQLTVARLDGIRRRGRSVRQTFGPHQLALL